MQRRFIDSLNDLTERLQQAFHKVIVFISSTPFTGYDTEIYNDLKKHDIHRGLIPDVLNNFRIRKQKFQGDFIYRFPRLKYYRSDMFYARSTLTNVSCGNTSEALVYTDALGFDFPTSAHPV